MGSSLCNCNRSDEEPFWKKSFETDSVKSLLNLSTANMITFQESIKESLDKSSQVKSIIFPQDKNETVGVIYYKQAPNKEFFYCGGIQDNQKHGEGILFEKSVGYFQGKFFKGSAHGKGRYALESQNISFEGLWENGTPIEGTLKAGEKQQKIKFYEGLRSAILGFENKNQMNYSGKIIDDPQANVNIINGQGKIKYENGDCYEGNLKSGVFHGTGTFKKSNGEVYQGNYVNGFREGSGTLSFEDTQLSISWRKNVPQGEGTFKYKVKKYKVRYEKGVRKLISEIP